VKNSRGREEKEGEKQGSHSCLSCVALCLVQQDEKRTSDFGKIARNVDIKRPDSWMFSLIEANSR
jgi:hypothetical protein